MSYQRIEVHPLAGSLGAEIRNIDLSQELDERTFVEVKQALLDNLVIFFRDQDITPDKQIAFGRKFGKLHVHPYIPSLEGYEEIITLDAESGEKDALRLSNQWHIDLSYTHDPPLAAILRAVRVPRRGGDTMWVNLYKAYDTLSDDMKRFLEGKTAVHDVCKTYRAQDLQREGGAKQYEHTFRTTPPVPQPIVKTHPETGRKLLYISELTTTRIEGLHPNESRHILNMLFEHIDWKELQCRFYWEKNSIAMWDNRCTAHYAVRDYDEQRNMHRVTVLGEVFA